MPERSSSVGACSNQAERYEKRSCGQRRTSPTFKTISLVKRERRIEGILDVSVAVAMTNICKPVDCIRASTSARQSFRACAIAVPDAE